MGNCNEPASTESKEVAATEEPPAAEGLGPRTFTIKFDKDPADKLGLDISHSADKKYVKVKNVKEGCVDNWNKKNPDKAVEKGDQLMEINGVKEDSQAMLDSLKGCSSVAFVVQKPEQA